MSKKTKINIGHLTHIEKGDRNPSHKALKSICTALEIPYQTLMYMYDREINDEQEYYKIMRHFSYNKVLAFDMVTGFIECPKNVSSASIAVKMPDSSMEPKIKKGDYVFVELNAPLNSNEVGLIELGGKYYIRKFIVRRDKLILRPENKTFSEIDFSEYDKFNIIGKMAISTTPLNYHYIHRRATSSQSTIKKIIQ